MQENNATPLTAHDFTESSGSRTTNIFGTLEIDGVGTFYVFASQSSSRVNWVLTDKDIFSAKDQEEHIEAILRVHNTGKMEGSGKTYLLTRLLDGLNVMVGRAAASQSIDAGFFVTGEYRGTPPDDSMITFKTLSSGRHYVQLDMVHEGFRLSASKYSNSLPFKIKQKLSPVVDEKVRAAMVAGLGVRTFAQLKRIRGDALSWYDKKDYRLIQTDEEFRQMMLEYLRDVQKAHDSNRAVLTAIDTETTGLNMLDLKANNPLRDYIVAIPFGWENDKAYVICTEMYYFDNVSSDEVYPLFHTLFHRNADYTGHDIVLDYCGEHFEFNRRSIMTVGANAGFDIRAFASHGAEVYFDEDIQIMHYNLATDWVQGKNSLKYMTRRYIGDETLELEDLFGPQHKDKYRYLSDPQLALVYGGADSDYPRALWKKLRRLTSNNLYALYKKYDITTLYRCSMATWRGMHVDERGVKEQGEAILQDLETLKDFIYKYAYAANKNHVGEAAEKLRVLLGLSTVNEVMDEGDKDGMYRYPFTPANHKHLLFNVLGYPVIKVSEKSQEPALDKFVLKKLASRKRDTPSGFLKVDIPSVSNPGKPLISKDEFNEDMYPLAAVFQKYATLNKEYTAYYKPIMTNDLEGRMFYTFSLQRAATRRILSPGQTMKSELKRLVVAPPGKLFMCYDASQIEYRHMASLAYIQTKDLLKKQYPDDWEKRLEESGIARIHKMMRQQEADYHIETASMMTGLPQYQIDADTRKMYKSIGFGIPYGLGDRSMCDSLFGKVTDENMVKTKHVLDDYKARQFEIIRLLETVRDSAFVPAQIPEEFRDMLAIGDTHVGIVRNFTGFYRLFILEGLTRAKNGRIRRQAGNCIIQGGAAELFRRMIYNFYMGCVNAGLDKDVDWLMLVHDEVDNIISADIDVCKLIDVIYTSCTLRYEDHIPYYVGIGFGHNWYDAKGDGAELPVIMVERLVKAYRAGKFSIPCDGNQPENLLKLKRHYMCDRVEEELKLLIPEVGPGFVWTDTAVSIVENQFTNYIVRSYLTSFLTKEEGKKYNKKNPAPLKIQLERWQQAREEYGFGKDFLSEKLVDARESINNLVLDAEGDGDDLSLDDLFVEVSADDLSIDLLSSVDEQQEMLLEEQRDQWYGEDALFDYGASDDELIRDDAGEGYRYFHEGESEDELEVNANPTNAFDVFVSKHYVRKHILPSASGTYTVMLNGTKFAASASVLASAVRKEYSTGKDTLLFIGSEIKKVSGIECTAEKLDKLDRIIAGEL